MNQGACSLAGTDRAILYVVAAYTGWRGQRMGHPDAVQL